MMLKLTTNILPFVQDKAAEAQKALEEAQEALKAAKEAAKNAEMYAEQIAESAGALGHAASGGAIDPFIFRFTIFVLAVVVGYYVVWNVTPALHTPLMAVTNAISSVIIVGALIGIGTPYFVDILPDSQVNPMSTLFGFLAVVLASVNIVGGFMVTRRMLSMYKSNKNSKGGKSE